MRRVLVFGGWFGSKNIGDDAILLGIKRVFELLDPSVELTALTQDVEYTTRVCGVKCVANRIVMNFGQVLAAYAKSDLVIVSGGTPLYDYGYFWRGLHIFLAKLLRKRLVFFGISSKKISTRYGKFLTRMMMRGIDSVTVREPETIEILGQVGINSKLVLTGDSSFMLGAEAVGSTRSLSGRLDAGTPLRVAICPRYLSADYKSHFHDHISYEAIQNIKKELAKTADYIADRYSTVVFVPFHQEKADNDLELVGGIASAMTSANFRIFKGLRTPSELLSLLSEFDLVIGMRFHSLVFAAINHVPLIAIDYDTKIRGLMKLLGQEEFLYSPLDSPQDLIAKVEKALSERRLIEKQLEQRVYHIRESILSSARGLLH